MKTENEELMACLNEQIAFEKEQSEALEKTIEQTKNTAVKFLLQVAQLDTQRHKLLAQGIIDILSGDVITDPDTEFVVKRFSDHVESETGMLKCIRKAVEKTKEPHIRMLLKRLASDEEGLAASLKAMMKKGDYTTLDIWDQFYAASWREYEQTPI